MFAVAARVPAILARTLDVDRRQLVIGGATLAVGLAGCSRDESSAPLRLAMDLWGGYFPALLADELGWFREAGLDVRIELPGNTSRMMAELAAGRVDLACMALADVVNLTRAAPVQVLLVSDESAGGDQVLLRPGGSLAAERLALGTNLGGFGELLMREFLARKGLSGRRLAWVNVDAAQVPQALAAGEIDIGHTWDPYAAEARAAGAAKVFSSADTPGLIPDVMAALQPLLDRRRDDLRRLTTQWFRAQDWWMSRRAEGDALLARRLKQTPDWVARQLDGVALRTLEDNRRALGAGGRPGGLAEVLRRYSEFFVRHGTLTRPLDPARVLRPDLLP